MPGHLHGQYDIIMIMAITIITGSVLILTLAGDHTFWPTTSYASLTVGHINSNISDANNKIIILTFGNAPKSQYLYAKPILDKYGFKASFFVVCNWIESEEKSGPRMTWQDIEELHNEGHDIEAKSMNHERLTELSAGELEYEVRQPKKCLNDHGINSTIFGTPYGAGKDNSTVLDTIAKYYDFAITGFSDLMFLHCDGYKNFSSQTDCRTYFDNGTLTPVNRYSIRESSQDSYNRDYYNDTARIFEEFVREVNSQSESNKNATTAIPIIAYHSLDNKTSHDSTNVMLFEKEMKYLFDNEFKVITMSDLGYDEENNFIYMKESRDSE
jgi:peptidoglycan/xylan/chitin deacetylase (PgdA/CDA1 family)